MEFLARISPLDMKIQKVELEKSFEAWKSNYEQVDDVSVIGIRV